MNKNIDKCSNNTSVKDWLKMIFIYIFCTHFELPSFTISSDSALIKYIYHKLFYYKQYDELLKLFPCNHHIWAIYSYHLKLPLFFFLLIHISHSSLLLFHYIGLLHNKKSHPKVTLLSWIVIVICY